ncbi:MAG: hypothetical protein ABIS50_02610 [Luteolibacter sp.]|uniref:hypothetical protein n=1 Tax=Luteolibacter sp. TaxID=1962973 RepID=UPI0032661C6F
MKIRHLIPALLVLLPLCGGAMEPAEPNGKAVFQSSKFHVIQVQVEYVEMSHEILTHLLFLAENKTSDATALRKQVQEMVARNEATVIETQMIAGKSGQKTSLQSNGEVIYPTEYDARPVCGAYTPNPGPLSLVPLAYDTRNCGSTLEIESTLSDDGKLVYLHLQPDLTWHTGNTRWLDVKDTAGSNLSRDMPDFYALRFDTVVSCAKGRYLMAAVLSPKDAKGVCDMTRKVMVFVKCDVLSDP